MDVGMDRVDGLAKVNMIAFVFSVLSIVLFPVIYLSSLFYLTLGPFFIESPIFGIIKSDPARYGEIFYSSLRLGLLGLVPWLMLAFGDVCDCLPYAVECQGDIGFVLPCAIFFLPWLGCVLTAFSFIHQIVDSALDCQCGIMQEGVLHRNPRYTLALSAILNKISDPNDPKSFFPTFVDPETASVVDRMPIEPGMSKFIMFMSIVIGLSPVVWVLFSFRHDLQDANAIELAMLVAAPWSTVTQFNYFFKHVEEITENFTYAVNELFIFLFISSKSNTRQQARMKKGWEKILQGNASFRTRMEKFVKGLPQISTAQRNESEETIVGVTKGLPTAPEGNDSDTASFRLRKSLAGSPLELRHRLQHVFPELTDIEERGVAINFTTADGVMLYRLLRDWLRLDILNERSGLEMFMTFMFPFFVAIWVMTFLQWLRGTLSVPFFGILFFLFLCVLYFIRGLSQCVCANEHLFLSPSKALFEWEDANVNGTHGLGQLQDVGWVWNTRERRVEPLKLIDAPVFLEVCGTDLDDTCFRFRDVCNDRPVYEQLMGHRFIYFDDDGKWCVGVDATQLMGYSSKGRYKRCRVLLQNMNVDAMSPPLDGWLDCEKSPTNVVVKETTWRDETAAESFHNPAIVLRNTTRWIEILQVTSELTRKLAISATSLMAPVASTVWTRVRVLIQPPE
eukprot:TRINITY_DN25630_c0_g2_i2.p1 TRINITY_DN25630_c0_g2~~TRINITY_DN25630_c0_g2_i2.p1  ORF type:complete len:789 (-),score=94.12 TRINITY_DN25630_c0_g2_i2:37-2070(-)